MTEEEKDDNKIENLELWVRPHVANAIRIEDLIKFYLPLIKKMVGKEKNAK